MNVTYLIRFKNNNNNIKINYKIQNSNYHYNKNYQKIDYKLLGMRELFYYSY